MVARRVLRPEEEPLDWADLGFDEDDELNAEGAVVPAVRIPCI